VETQTKKPDILSKVLVSIITFIVLLTIAELAGRLYVSYDEIRTNQKRVSDFLVFNYEEMKIQDEDIGYFYATDSSRTLCSPEYEVTFEFTDLGVDRLRFRDDGIDFNKKNRLLIVGDSFVWGCGVELDEIFTERLEKGCDDLDAINGGIMGYTPQQYTRMIKRFIKNNVGFDGVLYCFFAGNDVSFEYSFREWAKHIKRFKNLAGPEYMKNPLVSEKSYRFALKKAKAEAEEEKTFASKVDYFFSSWWVTYRAAKSILAIAKRKLGIASYERMKKSLDLDHNEGYIFPENPSVRGKNRKRNFLWCDFINEAATETLAESKSDTRAEFLLNYPLTIESILEAKDLCDSLNRDFYLLYIPSKAEVYADELCETLNRQMQDEIRGKMSTLHNTMINAFDSLSITVIDLLDEFKKHKDSGEQLYYLRDTHFNSRGHQLCADCIYKKLADAGFIK